MSALVYLSVELGLAGLAVAAQRLFSRRNALGMMRVVPAGFPRATLIRADICHTKRETAVLHPIPQTLIEAERLARWPSGRRLPGSRLSSVAPFMSTVDFELLSIDQMLGRRSSHIADLETLALFAKEPSSALHHRVYSGNNAQGPADLPWLDVDKALVIGGGADYGDDTWLALDYRLKLLDPRVVISQYRHYVPEAGGTAPSHIDWLVIAPNIVGFLDVIEGVADHG